MIHSASLGSDSERIPQMFYSRLRLKRFIAYGGIALALVGSAQQSHALCGFVACVSGRLTTTVALAEAIDSETKCDCCAQKSDPRDEAPLRSGEHSAPCGSNCWCCQPPQPRQAPRDSTKFTKARITTLSTAVDCALCIVHQPIVLDSRIVDVTQFSAHSSRDTCVRLCRFLT